MAYKYACFNIECRKECKYCDTNGFLVLDEQSDDFVCPNDQVEKLKEMGQTGLTVIGGVKMSKSDIAKDRKKRSKEHFQKEVLPYLPENEQKALTNKGLKKK